MLLLEVKATMTRAEYTEEATRLLSERPQDLKWLKVALLASFTADFLKPCLVVEAAQYGVGVEMWTGPFGQVEQQIMDPGSELYRSEPEMVIVLTRVEDWMPDLAWRFVGYTPQGLSESRRELRGRLEMLVQNLRQRTSAKILVGNFALPVWLAASQEDPLLEISQVGFWAQLNDDLASLCRQTPGVIALDVAAAAREVGSVAWTDARLAWLARAPLSVAALTALAKRTARRLRATFFPPKKCLVLDMDDTLWGGILGEAGLGGIALGPDYPGNVFVDFQRRVLALRDRGILLAAASKNNEAEVLQVLAEHPSCLLKREHFAAFEVHWQDKAASLRNIAQKLNIGTDALVFFDDNPVEREWVSSQLPDVSVVPVPKHVMDYGRVLDEGGWFDAMTFSIEDRQRADQYAHQEVRAQLRSSMGSLEDFIRSLEMKVTVGPVGAETLGRVEQLLGRTNQFNLTTRRHTASQLEAMIAAGALALWARVEDRFGDNGIVGVAIALPADACHWVLDTLLLSCRVLGRQVETAMLAVLEETIRQRGGVQLRGEFIPTSKNQPAADFFQRHGYQPIQEKAGAWELRLDATRAMPESYVVKRLPFLNYEQT
jgi:FkbH-like protein